MPVRGTTLSLRLLVKLLKLFDGDCELVFVRGTTLSLRLSVKVLDGDCEISLG
jgi:hypothetical protein